MTQGTERSSRAQPRLFLSPPHMGGDEPGFVSQAFASNYIAPLGPMVDAFEKEFADYTGICHALAVSSGTAAMHLALREVGVGPGDEVIASALTFIGSVSPATFLGASPVFIDSDRATWNMDPDLVADELEECVRRGRLPKAIVPTDLYGQCCNLPRIIELGDRYGVPVVCDSAESVGAGYWRTEGGGRTANDGDRTRESARMRHAGLGARAAVYSFNGNKIITTSGGGMLASDDGDLIAHARKLANQARDPAPHYEHSEIGYNYRMSNILAAIGRGQLRVIEQRVERRRGVFDAYRQRLRDVPGIEFMPEASYGHSNRWLTVILITPDEFGATCDEVRHALEEQNIEARPVWKPMQLQSVFAERRYRSAAFGVESGRDAVARDSGRTVSEDLFARGLCLPSGTAMTDEDIDRVADGIRGVRG